MLSFTYEIIASPTGDMMVVTDAEGYLRALEWTDLRDRMTRLLTRQYKDELISFTKGSMPAHIKEALDGYFAGNLHALDGIETKAGGTQFQSTVWKALRDIPVGQTRSYLDIAKAIGNPKAVRAIGLANGANPIGIVVPCHRVIGAKGAMTGYGGGIARKEWLLKHEGALVRSLI
jgi:methylated-DNA-[protein]-cysteine S-methyltransferase